jgi:thiamine biosynthesis lipoprotein
MKGERYKKINRVIPDECLFNPLLLLLIILIALSCSAQKEKIYRKSAILMDTAVTITVVSDSPLKAEESIDAAFLEIKRIQDLMNFWDEKSEISMINKNAGLKRTKVSPDTFDMIEKALYISEKTNGAFDATIGPVIRLYDFRKKTRPDAQTLREKLGLVNYKAMELNKEKSTAFLGVKGMSFDTGGIAKGYGADRAVAVLKRHGIKAGLVSVAGDIKAFGLKPDGKGWRIGIKNPRQKGKEDGIMAEMELLDEAVSTSGDYERYFMEGGRRYHHILNPKTGIPASGPVSVSVASKEGFLSDGLSTGIFALGADKGLKTMDGLGVNGIIVDSKGDVHITEGIKERVKIKIKPEVD